MLLLVDNLSLSPNRFVYTQLACSRLLAEWGRSESKRQVKSWRGGKKEKGRERQPLPPLLSPVSFGYIFVFVLSQFSGPDYLGAWNRLTRKANDRTFSSIFVFRITRAASPVIEISSVSNFIHISVPKFFFIKACNLCILTYLKMISRYLEQLPASLRKQTASLAKFLSFAVDER